jgi:hypothetical protein
VSAPLPVAHDFATEHIRTLQVHDLLAHANIFSVAGAARDFPERYGITMPHRISRLR